jgi:hypothetical protein
VSLGADPTPSHGLLINGSFEAVDEEGNIVGWRKHGGVLSRVDGTALSGRSAAGFYSASDSTKWMFQTVGVVPGHWYDAQAFIKHAHPHVESVLVRISWYRSVDGSGSALIDADSGVLDTSGTEYRPLSTGPVQAPPDAHSANVRILLRPRSSVSATIYVDDVSFVEASAPPAGAGDHDEEASEQHDPSEASAGSVNSDPSQVRGVAVREAAGITVQPSPVIRRNAALVPAQDSSGTDDLQWWPWVAGVFLGGAFLGYVELRMRAQGRNPSAEEPESADGEHDA